MSSIANSVKYWSKQFCLSTHLHGYKYIVLPRRVPAERLLWTVIVIVSIISASITILLSSDSIGRKTMIFVTDSINYPVWNYPFPAVTICSFNRISKLRAYIQAGKIKDKLNLNLEEITELLALLGQLYSNTEDVETTETKKYLKLLQLLDHNKIDLNRLLRSLSPSCSSIVSRCRWKGEDKSCDMLFEKIITSEGHCCSFNYYAPKNHTFRGSVYSARSPARPRRVSACGHKTSFEGLIETHADDYFSSDIQGFGNKIIVHNSYDYPDWSDQSYLLGLKVTALLGLNPSLTHSTPDLGSLSIRERSCYFREEFPLQNFRYYTYQNCLTECRMNLSRYYCGCIPVIYVNEDVRIPDDIKICSVRDIGCLNRYRPFIRSSMPGIEIESKNFSNYVWNPHNTSCNCLPECSSTSYNFQSSSSSLETKHTPWTLDHGLYLGRNLTNHSVIRVFFDDLVGTRMRRSVIGNWQTVLAFIRSSMPGIEIESKNFSNYVWNPHNTSCNCLPECSSTSYNFQSSSSSLETKHTPWTLDHGLYLGRNLTNHSVIRVFFDDLVGTRMRRSVIGNWQTVLAFYGGILGIFVGFNFISGIELIYFFTVKLLIDLRKRRVLQDDQDKKLRKHLKKRLNPARMGVEIDSRFPEKMKNHHLYDYLE